MTKAPESIRGFCFVCDRREATNCYNLSAMKMLALALLIAFSAVIVSGQPNQRSNANQPPATVKDPSAITLVCSDCAQTHTGEASANSPKWYRPEVWLVVVGFITCGLIWWQAKKTAEAAQAAQSAADAALKQANHIATSERAWMIAKMDKPEIPYQKPYIFFGIPKLTNKGKTPAFICEIGNSAVALESGEALPDIPSGYQEKHVARWENPGIPIAPGGEVGRWVALTTIDEPMDLHKGRKVLWVHGYVKYWDAFFGEIRETKYCFRLAPSAVIGIPDHAFVIDGPAAYNRAT
jgi:hypothetical protein